MFPGSDTAVQLSSGQAQLSIATAYGPRIMALHLSGHPNVFFTDDGTQMPDAKNGYRFYGGHRLWIAPETPERSMQPENEPVTVQQVDQGITVLAPADRYAIQKRLSVFALGNETFRVEHQLQNLGAYGVNLAPWALSMLAPGAQVIFPQPPFESHAHRLTPTRPIVTWGYTDLLDQRYTWGAALATLQQDPNRGATKVGTFVKEGYAAAQIGDQLLIKLWNVDQDATYTDMGCNFETFTNQQMIEIETLGAYRLLEPGESVIHTETWQLIAHRLPMEDELKASEYLRERVALIR